MSAYRRLMWSRRLAGMDEAQTEALRADLRQALEYDRQLTLDLELEAREVRESAHAAYSRDEILAQLHGSYVVDLDAEAAERKEQEEREDYAQDVLWLTEAVEARLSHFERIRQYEYRPPKTSPLEALERQIRNS